MLPFRSGRAGFWRGSFGPFSLVVRLVLAPDAGQAKATGKKTHEVKPKCIGPSGRRCNEHPDRRPAMTRKDLCCRSSISKDICGENSRRERRSG